MHCLVTGGAGFIGRHVVDALIGEGTLITVVDNFDPLYSRDLKLANLAGALPNPDFRLVESDICDPEALRRVEDSYDAIIHLAGKGGVRPSIDNPVAYQHVNVAGTHNLLAYDRRSAVPQIIFSYTPTEYATHSPT